MLHPDHLLDVLTAEQFSEWADYFNEEPFGFPAEDYRTALLGATIARAAGAKDVKLEHFMLRPPEEPEEDEVARVKRLLGVADE